MNIRGRGLIEVLSVKTEIIELLDKGYSFAIIYRHLYKEGKISLKYNQFRNILSIKLGLNTARLRMEEALKQNPDRSPLAALKSQKNLVLTTQKLFPYLKEKKVLAPSEEAKKTQASEQFGIIYNSDDENF